MNRVLGLFIGSLLTFCSHGESETPSIFPAVEWRTSSPAEVGLDSQVLDQIAEYLGGQGCLIRHGMLVYGW